jgi:hypothetical protein
MAKILPNYPKAFPRRESIKLDALTSPLTAPVVSIDSLVIEQPIIE